ncbi:hypothetical protein [Burkholderia ambifaria]|uniref:hypothetical protein n=1 Tax=Burkholderia ambifaria TaxID=152480 RepID=UPI000F80260E|nr:hypothetical protein [Burkholderia ambifaria]
MRRWRWGLLRVFFLFFISAFFAFLISGIFRISLRLSDDEAMWKVFFARDACVICRIDAIHSKKLKKNGDCQRFSGTIWTLVQMTVMSRKKGTGRDCIQTFKRSSLLEEHPLLPPDVIRFWVVLGRKKKVFLGGIAQRTLGELFVSPSHAAAILLVLNILK